MWTSSPFYEFMMGLLNMGMSQNVQEQGYDTLFYVDEHSHETVVLKHMGHKPFRPSIRRHVGISWFNYGDILPMSASLWRYYPDIIGKHSGYHQQYDISLFKTMQCLKIAFFCVRNGVFWCWHGEVPQVRTTPSLTIFLWLWHVHRPKTMVNFYQRHQRQRKTGDPPKGDWKKIHATGSSLGGFFIEVCMVQTQRDVEDIGIYNYYTNHLLPLFSNRETNIFSECCRSLFPQYFIYYLSRVL